MNHCGEPIRLVVVTGPTAAGKTGLAVDLCRRFGGEIISADSMQVYRYMDIGTAKPTHEERLKTPHHLVDIIDPDESFSAARFRLMASEAACRLHREGTLPVVAGGTGLYIDALLDGLIDAPPADEELRSRYREQMARHGREHLHTVLRHRDPVAAARIHPRDAVRVMRALEVLELTGISVVRHWNEQAPQQSPFLHLKIGLLCDRRELFKRIDERADGMMEEGLLRETEQLLDRGYDEALPAMQSFCYRHMVDVLRSRISLDEAVRRLKRDTRQYARRQMTWFRRDGQLIPLGTGDRENAAAAVERFLSGGSDSETS